MFMGVPVWEQGEGQPSSLPHAGLGCLPATALPGVTSYGELPVRVSSALVSEMCK